MRFTVVPLALLATMAAAFQVESAEPSVETPAVNPLGVSRAAASGPIFSCKGSTLCGSTPGLLGYCDRAVYSMHPGQTFSTSGGPTGNCWGNSAGYGCGVFVAGPSGCYRSTEQIQAAYANIRRYGCRICGYVQNDDNRGDACQIKIDYVSGCDNH